MHFSNLKYELLTLYKSINYSSIQAQLLDPDEPNQRLSGTGYLKLRKVLIRGKNRAITFKKIFLTIKLSFLCF